jgi:hypothetical protein
MLIHKTLKMSSYTFITQPNAEPHSKQDLPYYGIYSKTSLWVSTVAKDSQGLSTNSNSATY